MSKDMASTTDNLPRVQHGVPEGLEDATSDSYALPFIQLLQPGSPVCKVEGRHESVQPGRFYDNISGVAYKTLTVIPVLFQARWVEWQSRRQGGKFVGVHLQKPATAEYRMNAQGKNCLLMPNDNEIVDSRQYYVLFQDADKFWNPALIVMKSTGIKISKMWNTQMRMNREVVVGEGGRPENVVKPIYTRSYEIFAHLENNDLGDWYNWQVRAIPAALDAATIAEGKAFYALLKVQNAAVADATFSNATDDTATEY